MPNNKKAAHIYSGEKAEDQAYAFLIAKGFKPVCRNFRCKPGEIDLVMEDKNTLVFVEVRYRNSDKYGSALESITVKKQARIIAAANYYLVSNKIEQPARFDVIAISGNNTLKWVPNAFQAFT